MSDQPIVGYRNLTPEEVALMNEGKQLAVLVGKYIEKLSLGSSIDQRWVEIGKTDLQQGFMALTRSIARPTTF